MTILITGGAGYIGSNMAYLLSDVGERSVILDTLETGFIESIPKDISFYQGCAGDQNLVKQIISDHEIQEVIHFAGHTIVPESVENPIKYYRNNTINTINLLSACQESGVQKVVFSSTAAVYGNVSDSVRSETYPCEPATPYGRSKLMSEQVFADLASAWPEFRYIALRYFNVAGADPRLRTGQSTKNATHLIKVACEAALGIRDTFHLYGNDYATPDGTCIRDFVHVSDLVAAHYKALEYLRANGASRVLNCGYGRGVFCARSPADCCCSC